MVLESYYSQANARKASGVAPKPLTADETRELCGLLKVSSERSEEFLDLLENCVPPGVDEAAKVKADFLYAIAKGTETSACITPEKAVRILGTMLGGYNVSALIDLLDDPKLGSTAADALSKTILIFDSFDKVAALAEKGSENAKKVIKSWSDGKWFLDRPKLKDTVTLTGLRCP